MGLTDTDDAAVRTPRSHFYGGPPPHRLRGEGDGREGQQEGSQAVLRDDPVHHLHHHHGQLLLHNKRRPDGRLQEEEEESPQTSQVEMEEEEARKILPSDVQTGREEEAGEDRNAKFLVYWLTTTSTSTSTTYSTTSTLASLECTPSGFSLPVCG